MFIGPNTDPDYGRSWQQDVNRSRLRAVIGSTVWFILSSFFFVFTETGFEPLVIFGGPLLLLILTKFSSMASIPVFFVVLASFGGIGWEILAAEFPPWSTGLIFAIYLFSFEEALSGLVKLRYLRSTAELVYGYDDAEIEAQYVDHLIAKRRIWGYILATSSVAVIAGGVEAGSGYLLVLILILALTFLVRTHFFRFLLLHEFPMTRTVVMVLTDRPRWSNTAMALVNAAAYGLGLYWLVTNGSTYGVHVTGWTGLADIDGDWLSDFQTVLVAFLLWTVAAFRFEWTF